MGEPTFTIAEIAREFDVTLRTIRHYEEQGLICPRREGQQRVYSKRDRTRLRLALRGKRLGLPLVEIKDLIEMYDTAPDDSPQLVRFLAVLAKRKSALLQKREDIEAVLAEIAAFEQQCQGILAEKGGPTAVAA